jgi:hypothetical protein
MHGFGASQEKDPSSNNHDKWLIQHGFYILEPGQFGSGFVIMEPTSKNH